MPRKSLSDKKSSYKNFSSDVDVKDEEKSLSLIEKNYKQIIEMQDRILSAPAMNGGFTTLLYKVEKIEQIQAQLVEKVDQIHNVLYEPDNGLYARIKNVEKDCVSSEKIDFLEKDVQEIKIWKTSEEKNSEKNDEHEIKQEKIIQQHEEIIKDLQSSISKYNAAVKWITVSLGGGLLSIVGKIIYDYISGHIKIV